LANFWLKQLEPRSYKEERPHATFSSIFTKQSSLTKGSQTQITKKRYQTDSSSVTSKSSRLKEVYHRSQILLPIFSQINQHMEICRQEKQIGIILENQRLAAADI